MNSLPSIGPKDKRNEQTTPGSGRSGLFRARSAPSRHLIRRLAPMAALALWPGLSAMALDGTWNNTRTGNQTWASSGNWLGSTIANGAGATATFNAAAAAGISASLGTTDRTIGSITVNNVTSSTNAIGIGGTASLILQTTAPGSHPVLAIDGAQDVGLSTGSGVVLAGTQGFEKTGAGWLSISGTANTFTGDVILTAGGIRSIAANALNSQNLVVNGTGTEWRVDAGEHASNVILRNGDATITGVGPTTGTADSTLSGAISQEGATARNVTYYNSAGGANRVKRFIVSGSNSYTGNTTIGRASQSETILRVTDGNAFGAGTAEVTILAGSTHDHNTLELSGGIAVANKTLTLAGGGQTLQGSLLSLDGENLWAGDVRLGTAANPRIGVADGRLTISGEVSGSTSGGLIKVGVGTLELSGSNSYSEGTNLIQGKIVVSHPQALGSGGIALRNESILQINTGVNAEVASLSLVSTDAHLVFRLNGSFLDTGLHVAGDQTGTGTYTVDILDGGGLALGAYPLLTVDGAWNAAGFTLGTMEGPYTGSLALSGQVLTLNVVPEPESWAFLGLGLGLTCLLGRRKWNLRKA